MNGGMLRAMGVGNEEIGYVGCPCWTDQMGEKVVGRRLTRASIWKMHENASSSSASAATH